VGCYKHAILHPVCTYFFLFLVADQIGKFQVVGKAFLGREICCGKIHDPLACSFSDIWDIILGMRSSEFATIATVP
jgi:hypothetical protein